MKKFMFLVPLAALAMASCSSDNVVEQSVQNSSDMLQIRPNVQKITRGTVIGADLSNFDDFKLIMEGSFKEGNDWETAKATEAITSPTTVTLAKAANWALTSKTWWADGTTTGKFTAYAPVDLTADGGIISDVIPATDIAQQKDIVVAYNEGVKTDFASGVPLTFRHVMSQVVVKALNKSAEAVTIKVKAVKLVNINSKNNLVLPTTATAEEFSWDSYNPWPVAASVAKSFRGDYADDSEVTLNGTAKDIVNGTPMILLPQQLADATLDADGNTYASGNAIAVLIKVVTTDASPVPVYPTQDAMTAATANNELPEAAKKGYAWVYIPVNTLWEPSKKYIYTLNFAEGAYGLVAPKTEQSTDGTPNPNDVDPGEPVVDNEVELTFNVSVVDWEEVAEAKNLNN